MLFDDVPQTPTDGGVATDDAVSKDAGEDMDEMGDTKDKPDDNSEEGGATV